MKLNNISKKAQGLPLNTIVIAILVVIVLLVIIVFFTSKVGQQGDVIDDTSGQFTQRGCTLENPAIAVFNYNSVRATTPADTNNDNTPDACPDQGTRIQGINDMDEGQWCCGYK